VAQASVTEHGWQVFNGGEDIADALGAEVKDVSLAGASIYVSEVILQRIGNNKYALISLSNSTSPIVEQALGTGLTFGIANAIFDQTTSVYNLYSEEIETAYFVDVTRSLY
jgi:hypothetical protein